MSIVWNHKVIDTVPLGFESLSWRDDPKLPPTTDLSTRRLALRSIILHTTSGKRGPLRPGSKPSTRAEAFARYQATSTRQASWDYTIDTDGMVVASNDPVPYFTWHATSFNQFSIGIEIVQDDDGSTYEVQYKALVALLDLLTGLGGVPRQWAAKGGSLIQGVLPRADEKGTLRGRDLYGIYAHFHNTKNRGAGDPGEHAFSALKAAGYEGFDVNSGEDQRIWKQRQASLGLTQDGQPGPATMAALKKAGKPLGQWVARPTDARIAGLTF